MKQDAQIKMLLAENEELRHRLQETDETLEAIRTGRIDAVVVSGPDKAEVYTLSGADKAYRILFETMNEGASIVGTDGTIFFCNTRLAAMLRVPLETIIGASVKAFVAPDDNALIETILTRGVNEPQKVEVRLRGQAGHNVPALISTSPFSFEESTSICMIITDLTDRKQAEEALQQTLDELTRSNRDLEEFAHIASHDLQEPLRNVSTCLQILEKDYKDKLGPDADQLIKYAVDAIPRMKALIYNLLAYARVTGIGTPSASVNCEQIFEKTLLTLGPAIDESSAVVTHDPLPAVYADATQLLQVFQNLTSNAIKFRGDQPPKVHISAEKSDSEWVFSVSDNGIGMESHHLEKIFKIFYRLHGSTQFEGSGVGLAIVKKIIDTHKGRIWVESEPGKGSTFYFTIPTKEGNA